MGGASEEVQEDLSPAEAEHGGGDGVSGVEGARRAGDPDAATGAAASGLAGAAAARAAAVAESIRYRRRAQAAEARARELEAKFAAAQRELEEARGQVEAVERRQRIDQLLMESEAIDLEAARLLTEVAVEQMEEPDVQAAVSELKRRKPYLFRRSAATGAGTMSAKPRSGRGHELGDAAEAAASTGDRRDLLRYLRLRRNGAR